MTIFIFILGACLASFTTLVAQRLTVGQSPWFPSRSYCDNCKHSLAWWQLIPILGFCIQRGKCNFCRVNIPLIFPIIELLVGLFFTFLFNANLFHDLTIALAILTLVFISVTDYFAQYIYPLVLLGLAPLFILFPLSCQHFLIASIICVLLVIFSRFSRTLGIGDIEYIFVICLLFGWQKTLIVIQGASIVMLFVFLLTKNTKLPFIPALSLSTLCTLCMFT